MIWPLTPSTACEKVAPHLWMTGSRKLSQAS